MTDQQPCANCSELWKRVEQLEKDKAKLEKKNSLYTFVLIFMMFVIFISIVTRRIY